MHTESAARRWLPILATGVLLGITGWQLVDSALPPRVMLVEIEVVVVAAVMLEITIRLRRAARVSLSTAALVQGLTSVALCTIILGLAEPRLEHPVPLIVLGFVAVLLTVNPSARKITLWTILLASCAGLAGVWWWSGMLVGGGVKELIQIDALVIGVSVLAYFNWSLTERHYQAQTRRLRAVADVAQRLGLTTDSGGVAAAVLSGCHEAYPDATWGRVLLFDTDSGALATLPLILGHGGVTPAAGPLVTMGAGEGVIGRVYSTGAACLLRTPRDIRQAYAAMPDSHLDELESLGGGRRSRSFVAAPLRATGGRVIGVLALISHARRGTWDVDDLTVVEAIADEAAVAVARAGLFEEKAMHATTDPLTKVGNRRAFEERLGEMSGATAVVAIDVDHLKPLNDEFGHEAGDMLLVEVARTLRAQLRAGDQLLRIGGDEFVSIMDATSEEEAIAIAERMRLSLHGVALPHGKARISAGVAAGAGGVHALWLAADEALSRAKHEGRDRVVVAGELTLPTLLNGGGDAGAMLDAILSKQRVIRATFQPIVRLADHKVLGYEALARVPGLRDPLDGVEDVFALAHRRGVTKEVDWICRRIAMSAASALPDDAPLFLNVSAAMLLDPIHPVDHMLLLARWAERNPETIVLEITERESIADKQRLRFVLASYREHGFRFALDDIGEGHSTLELLAAAVPEYVKVAKSITQDWGERGARAVIEATVAYARSSGSTVIAEGIEDEATADQLTALGVTAGQGYWLGRPEEPVLDTSARGEATA
ncbi:MAG TPA: bifunctional diguanylate cyclase/phosphodiesterase [Candidatus Saccharimonadales bacterium]|nr:bifunctional diguanylate cyclase/phosphodiesterase [Candidatus Saccharimonadales bacterium]